MLIILFCMTFPEEFLTSLCPINLNIVFPLRTSSLSLCFCNFTCVSHISISPFWNVLPAWLMSLFLYTLSSEVKRLPWLLLPLPLAERRSLFLLGYFYYETSQALLKCSVELSIPYTVLSSSITEYLHYLFLHFQCLAIVCNLLLKLVIRET